MTTNAEDVVRLTLGDGPLIVSFPHDGTAIPADLEDRMTPAALRRPDTDWHVARLYEFCGALGLTTLVARQSRYVVDLNRDPEGAELYPGADNTGLCPTSTFDREPIYQPGQEPSADEIAARTDTWFLPYHCALAERIAEHVARHGLAVVLDAHSIRSQVPRFFSGTLPDLNLGTASGKSADEGLSELAFGALAQNADYVAVRDGRFKGGYITRRYGDPASGVSTLQLELAQKNYMDESDPFEFDETKARLLRSVLRPFVEVIVDWANQRVRK
jgi:N-formylglutamate deformylase